MPLKEYYLTKVFIILVVTAIFIGVAFWVYTTYVAPTIDPQYVLTGFHR